MNIPHEVKLAITRAGHDELARVLGLPEHLLTEDEHGQALSAKWTARFRKHPDAPPLRPVQGILLETAELMQSIAKRLGLVGSIGVGKGKTLAFLLLTNIFDTENPLLLLPPKGIPQFREDIHYWSQHYRFKIPDLLSYAKLSRPDGTDVLRRKAPDLILADECQNIANALSARTKRFLRFMDENPAVPFVPMSGTITSTDIEDFATLTYLALGRTSPIPEGRHRDSWCSVMNADSTPGDTQWHAVQPLMRWAGQTSWRPPGTDGMDNDEATRVIVENQDAVREAFFKRFASVPGVVCTTSSSCPATLTLNGRKDVPMSPAIKEALEGLEKRWEMPNGDPVVDALRYAAAAKQLCMGFYYVWQWPDDKADEKWLEARSDWAATCRWYLKHNGREGCDSPYLLEEWVRERLEAGEYVLKDLKKHLLAWDEQRGKPAPPVKPVWIDYGVVAWAVAWAMENGGFLWFDSRAVGECIRDMFNVPTFWKGRPDPKKHRYCALSTKVFHKGFNFQGWNTQLVMEPPANAAIWEQLLGRQHRQGQKSLHVNCDVAQHAWPVINSMARAMRRARYLQNTTGQLQKLLLADTTDIKR